MTQKKGERNDTAASLKLQEGMRHVQVQGLALDRTVEVHTK